MRRMRRMQERTRLLPALRSSIHVLLFLYFFVCFSVSLSSLSFILLVMYFLVFLRTAFRIRVSSRQPVRHVPRCVGASRVNIEQLLDNQLPPVSAVWGVGGGGHAVGGGRMLRCLHNQCVCV